MKDKFYNLFRVIGEYAFYGIMFFLSISNALTEIFVVLMFLSFVGCKIIKPDFRFLKFWPNIFLLSFLLFSALSLLNSGVYLNKSLNALFGKWMQYLGICFIVQDTVYDRKLIKRGMFVFLSGASLAVLSGLSQHFFGIEFLRHRGIADIGMGMRPITSSFNHYNDFAGYLVIVLLLTVALLLENNHLSLKAVGLLIMSMASVLAVIFTFSRGSWLALICAFIFLAFISRKRLIWLVPVFILVFFIFLFYYPLHQRLLFSFSSSLDNDRFRYWTTAFHMIKDHPFFGVGLGTFMGNFSKYSAVLLSPAYAHNCYLQIWAEAGIFSLVSFIFFILSIVYLGIKKFIISKDFLLFGLLTGAVGFLIHSFFDTNLYSLRLAILFWVWVGLISALISRKQEEI